MEELKDDYLTSAMQLLKIAVLVVLALTILGTVLGSFYIIDASERGVLLTWGKPATYAVEPGLHFKTPWMQSVEIFDVKTQKYETDASAASRDLQTVSTRIAVNYRLNPEAVPIIYTELGHYYADRIIQPAVQEVVKASTAKFSAEELITNRADVKDMIQNLLKERLAKFNIDVEEIAIIDFEFSPAFKDAIEAKVTAEQQKLKAERDYQRTLIEANMTYVKADAEARALERQKSALTPELVELRKIDAQRAAIERWDGHLPSATVGMPFLDVTPSKGLSQ
ncbi:MAG: prohibitin family protein [Methanotrichaceae archaeon]|nr:prohibitin family protein [Methanotrichaceae archaeon]